MSDPLYELLSAHLPKPKLQDVNTTSPSAGLSSKYLSRLLSLRLTDLTTTEPQSLAQSNHSNNVSIQALSSRSHKSTTSSASHLSTLHTSLPSLTKSITSIRESIPSLDESAVHFADTYARSRDAANSNTTETNPLLLARRNTMLLARQSTKLTDILDLPPLLSTAITSAASNSNTASGAANYSQALDLFAHIRRLSIIYPDSPLIQSIQSEAQTAMKAMTTNLLSSLRSPTIRLAAAIRTIGWLRRVVPDLSHQHSSTSESEASFGALFLVSRLHTFITLTEALAPLRDLADQETERRVGSTPAARDVRSSSSFHGTQTERYLKRYIEIFREQSFSTVSMYRNVFPVVEAEADPLALPSALHQFPLYLVEIFMEVLRVYLPNITDSAARESLLMQVLYAANSLGRLGADFSLMIGLLDEETRSEMQPADEQSPPEENGEEQTPKDEAQTEPEWARIIKKHRVQAARLDALAAGRKGSSQPGTDIAVN